MDSVAPRMRPCDIGSPGCGGGHRGRHAGTGQVGIGAEQVRIGSHEVDGHVSLADHANYTVAAGEKLLG